VRGLTFGAISMLVLSLLLFAGYFVVLHSGASDIRALVSRS
jgi:hypothetical protein